MVSPAIRSRVGSSASPTATRRFRQSGPRPTGPFGWRLKIFEANGYQLTIFAGAGEARRRAIAVESDVDEDVGDDSMLPSEHAAGIRGVLWDDLADVPFTAGRIRLEQGDV